MPESGTNKVPPSGAGGLSCWPFFPDDWRQGARAAKFMRGGVASHLSRRGEVARAQRGRVRRAGSLARAESPHPTPLPCGEREPTELVVPLCIISRKTLHAYDGWSIADLDRQRETMVLMAASRKTVNTTPMMRRTTSHFSAWRSSASPAGHTKYVLPR